MKCQAQVAWVGLQQACGYPQQKVIDGQTTEMRVMTDTWNRKKVLNLSWLSTEVTQSNGEPKVKLKSEGSIWRPDLHTGSSEAL